MIYSKALNVKPGKRETLLPVFESKRRANRRENKLEMPWPGFP